MFTRDEIYDRVWNFPTTKLTKSFGMSDVGIAKLCKKLRIPKPPRGYWAKSQNHAKSVRPPLPVLDKKIPIRRIIFRDNPQNNRVKIKPENLQHVISPKAFILPSDFKSDHPLVKKTRAAFRSSKPDDYGRVRPTELESINVAIAKDSIDYAMNILNALLRGLEKGGYSVIVTNGPVYGGSVSERWQTYALIGTERVRFLRDAPSKREEKKPTAKERESIFYNRQNFKCGKKLRLIIDEYVGDNVRIKWTIREDRPLEETLASFVDGLIDTAKVLKERELKREQQKREWEEREQKKIEFETKIRILKTNTAAWDETQKYRRFLEALEAAIIQKRGAVDPQSNEGVWLVWAKKYVAANDPIEFLLNPRSDP